MECEGLCFVYSLIGRLLAYFGILALLVMISILILKCLGEWRERRVIDVSEQGENSPLMSRCCSCKTATTSYGACEQDLELGNCSTSSNSSNCADEELYDAKICVICYDQQRNCFFVPCGHRATCHVCAQRIFYEEGRNCPVCRRFIGKIRKLFDS